MLSGNPGGRPKKKPITEELERLLIEEALNVKGRTWPGFIAEALLRQARRGDVRAVAELANRIEGKPLQAISAGYEDSMNTSAMRNFDSGLQSWNDSLD